MLKNRFILCLMTCGIMLIQLACSVSKNNDAVLMNDQLNLEDNSAHYVLPDFNLYRFCEDDKECEVVDQDCCKTGKFIPINSSHDMPVKSFLSNYCIKILAAKENKDLCKDKKESSAAAKATCVDNQCTIEKAK